MKSVCIWSFSGPYFPLFGLNAEIYGVSLLIQFECGKIRNRKTPNTDTYHAVRISHLIWKIDMEAFASEKKESTTQMFS